MTLAIESSERVMGSGGKGKMRLAAAWMLLRLPAVMVLAFVFRGAIVRAFEATVGIEGVVEQMIYLLSTATTRILYWLAASALLLLGTWAARRLLASQGRCAGDDDYSVAATPASPLCFRDKRGDAGVAATGERRKRGDTGDTGVAGVAGVVAANRPTGRAGFWVPVILAGIVFAVSMRLTERSQWVGIALGLTALFAVNTLGAGMIDRMMGWRAVRWIVVVVPGVAEVLLPRLWWTRLRRMGTGRPAASAIGWESTAVAILVVTGLSAVLLRGIVLVDVDRRLHADPAVQLLARGDFNCVELDPAGRYLFACGHELNHLQRYDLRHPAAPPLESAESLGHAQSFAYSRSAGEIYVLNPVTNDLLYFDAGTLGLKRSVKLPKISPGDARIVCDEGGGRLVISSEADEQTGVPFVVVDRQSGQVVQVLEEEAGNLLMNPDRPRVYLSFFRRSSDLLVYDLAAGRVTQKAPADARSEKMAFWKKGDEVLVTSPMRGRIQRFGASDLSARGWMKTVFAGRTVAVDQRRNLLLCGSLATDRMVVVELASGRRVASFYVGPWLRTISLDEAAGVAYVSSNGGIFRVDYGRRVGG